MKRTEEKTGDTERYEAIIRFILTLTAAGILAAVFYSTAASGAEDAGPVKYTTVPVGGGKTLKMTVMDLSTGEVEIASSSGRGYSTRVGFKELAENADALAAINGCYFDMRTGRLLGKVYTDGRPEFLGMFSAAFAVRLDNRAVIAPLKELGDTRAYKTIITCVDILIRNGEILVKSKKYLVRNGHNPSRSNDIYRPARWSAIGIGKSGQVYFVGAAGRMTIYDFTRAVRKHTEIVDLLGLDGGSSSGLYHLGQTHIAPARRIPAAIVARKSRDDVIAMLQWDK